MIGLFYQHAARSKAMFASTPPQEAHEQPYELPVKAGDITGGEIDLDIMSSHGDVWKVCSKIFQTFPLGLGDGQFYAWTDGLRRKDWHDYGSMQKEAMRSGKGEHGKPYPLTEEDHDDSAYRENGFNIFVSNNIALERSLPDIRHANCKHKMYLERLPNTSIIIPFHNEGWTSLLRTIHSIINRTPESLIAEIILVDDFSDRVEQVNNPSSSGDFSLSVTNAHEDHDPHDDHGNAFFIQEETSYFK
ncbi:hypothetical protein MJG53_003152 [Ovis ammon polii x Ovis aries]|uniref:Uncharacterized protein n=1 Tax=Ovis ammon polii x Ovis aries TaxID=2918886 RepID=A0ACB9VGU8_9CETA|nr:hypothetical protein MJG53_003152 [Ovis ammon polii x Ovis aries]